MIFYSAHTEVVIGTLFLGLVSASAKLVSSIDTNFCPSTVGAKEVIVRGYGGRRMGPMKVTG